MLVLNLAPCKRAYVCLGCLSMLNYTDMAAPTSLLLLSSITTRSPELSRQVLLSEACSFVGLRLPDSSDMLPKDCFLFSSAHFESYQGLRSPSIYVQTAFTKYSKLLSMLRSLSSSTTTMLTFVTRLSHPVLVLVKPLHIVISRFTLNYYILRT